MRRITIKRARTWHYRKIRRCVEPSNGLAPLSPFRSWQGYIINTSGYDFWKGQEDGNTYSANISLVSSNILRVQGCFLGFLCGGENWTRVNPPNTNHAPPSPNSSEAPTGNLLETDKHVCLRLVGPSGLPPESGRGYR